MKFIVVSGGVLSGLGKGVTTASIALLLESSGIKTTAVKCDMYLNIDAGTMNPKEHGEVFVTHDGLETDQDLGHYERFIGKNHLRINYMTSGQIYKIVLKKERALEYGGACVQPYHHIPPEIISRWYQVGKAHDAQVVLIELGGTVGEYEGLLFFEAVRRLRLKRPNDVILVHVGYLPAPPSIGELKSKPIQQSISTLNSLGLMPDVIIARAEKSIDLKRKEKIALVSGLSVDHIISNPDKKSIYEIPLELKKQDLDKKIAKKLKIRTKKTNLTKWQEMLDSTMTKGAAIKIALVGKYQNTGDYTLEDSYVCVVEALKHAGCKLKLAPEIIWIDSEKLNRANNKLLSKTFIGVDAVIVPQGWGARGTEGKIKAIKFARENNIPFLGLCFGMQMATIEYGREVVGIKSANSEEFGGRSNTHVIHIMDEQRKHITNKDFGATIRLGAWPCKIKKDTLIFDSYRKYGNGMSSAWYQRNYENGSKAKPKRASMIYERHRHRYEFNNKYRKRYQKKGFVISGTSPDGNLVEAIEIKNHPFFVGVQFHPEYLSRPLAPHPIFLSFLDAARKIKTK